MQHQDLCDNLPQTHDVRAMHHVHVTDVVPRKLDGTLFPTKMRENAPQKRVVASDNLHSGSDWPVSSRINLILKGVGWVDGERKLAVVCLIGGSSCIRGLTGQSVPEST